MLPAVIFWLPGTELLREEKYGPRQAKNPNVQSKFSRMLLTALLLVLSVGALTLVGCSNLTPEPSAGQQTVTITATGSGNVSQSVSVQVTVQ